MVFYIVQIVMALVIIVLFETGELPVGVMAADKQSEFVLTALMEILSLGAAFLGLRLFKFQAIHRDLVSRKEPAMWKWGMTRLLILQVPMVINTLLYYIYEHHVRLPWHYTLALPAVRLPFPEPLPG